MDASKSKGKLTRQNKKPLKNSRMRGSEQKLHETYSYTLSEIFEKLTKQHAFFRGFLFFRSQDYYVLVALLLRRLIDFGGISKPENEFLEFVDGKLLVAELATAERHRHFHHVALSEKFATAIGEAIQVSRIGAESEADDLHFRLLAVRLLLLLLLLQAIQETAVITEFHHRWNGFRRHFDQIESRFLRATKRLRNRQFLRGTVIGNEEHLRRTDLFVVPWFIDIEDWTGVALSQRKRGKKNNGRTDSERREDACKQREGQGVAIAGSPQTERSNP